MLGAHSKRRRCHPASRNIELAKNTQRKRQHSTTATSGSAHVNIAQLVLASYDADQRRTRQKANRCDSQTNARRRATSDDDDDDDDDDKSRDVPLAA